MNISSLPFNITLLTLTAEELKKVSQIKVLDITDGVSKNFHPAGLFSTEIFGKIGEERRNRTFGYIDMYVSVFHPVVYKALADLKELYAEILSGQSYAVFNKETRDFERSNAIDGETGFAFFLKHFNELMFEKRPSAKREHNIKLIDMYRDKCMFDKLVVMPAGLRDYVVDEQGKPSEDEINTLYRRVMSVAAVIENISVKTNIEYLDSARNNLQQRVNEIYQYIVNLLEGKNKLFQGKWASRKIFDSTRNVITPYVPKTDVFFTPRTISTNQTTMGLYQFMRGIMPLAVKLVRDTYLSRVFVGPNAPAVLVNKKTLKKELVQVSPDYYEDWMTYEGLEKLMSRFGQEEIRDDVLEVEGYYIGLIYKDKTSVKFIQDIDEVPSSPRAFDKKNVRPITYCELLYLSIFESGPETPTLVTRYPITGYGSVYPSYVYLKTTVNSESVELLDDEWNLSGKKCYEFPISGEKYFNAMSPAPSHLGRLGADYDGDQTSSICLLTEEAKDEIRNKLNDKSYYLNPNGAMAFSASNDIIDLVLSNVTG